MTKDKNRNTVKRYWVIFIMMIIAATAILGSAVTIMVPPQSDYWEVVDKKTVKENLPIEAHRGNLLSDDGRILSTSLPQYRLYIDFRAQGGDSLSRMDTQKFRDTTLAQNIDVMAKGLAQIFPDKSEQYFRKRLADAHDNCMRKVMRKNKDGKDTACYPGPRRLYPYMATYDQYRRCKELPLLKEGRNKGGFYGESIITREKPYGSLATRTLGGLRRDSGERAMNGLELSYDTILRGTPGVRHFTKIRNKSVSVVDVKPVDGHDLMTTIDIELQDVAERALKNKMMEERVNGEIGVVAVMEVATGDVKAIVNLHRNDQGEFVEDMNYAVSALWEPGSTFKTASVMAALDDGKISRNQTVDTGNGKYLMHGREMRDHNWRNGGYGMLNLTRVMMKSSNIGVSRLIDDAYRGHPERFQSKLYELGILRPLNLPIKGAANPHVRHPYDTTFVRQQVGQKVVKKPKSVRNPKWSATDLAWSSIGYVESLPPISTLTFYNGIANNGRMLRPRFVTKELEDGKVVSEFPVQTINEKMCSQKTLGIIHDILDSVVMSPGGLGSKAGMNGKRFRVSGKTGTAQLYEKGYGYSRHGYMVSFCGYFPSEKPKYSCIVCIVHHGAVPSGGGQCGPVFCEISKYLMTKDMYRDIREVADTVQDKSPQVARGNGRRASQVLDMLGSSARISHAADTTAASAGHVPDMTGMGARDAVDAARRLGLRVRMVGRGRVCRQSITPGAKAVNGQTISLTLE